MQGAAYLIPVLLFPLLAAQPPERKAQVQARVKEAIAFGRKHGKVVLLNEINQGQGRFHVKTGEETYNFIYDMAGVCQAIGFQSKLVGLNRWNLKDPDGRYFLQDMIRVAQTRGSGWVDYKYPNPKNGKIEDKTSYVEYLDGWVVGCGVYK